MPTTLKQVGDVLIRSKCENVTCADIFTVAPHAFPAQHVALFLRSLFNSIFKHWRCVDKIKIVLESVLLTFSLCFLSAQHVALFLRSLFNSIHLICFNKECTVEPTSDSYQVTVTTEIGYEQLLSCNKIIETMDRNVQCSLTERYVPTYMACQEA